MVEISRLPRPFADLWEWQYSGACQDLPSEMFFHPDGERGPSRRNRVSAAKIVCASCPVINECRDHALNVQLSARVPSRSKTMSCFLGFCSSRPG